MTQPTQPAPLLVTQWAVCGIAAAAARFVPVPLLDDVIREQAARLAVVRTLRAHGQEGSAAPLEPLWDDDERAGSGLRRRLRALSMRVLLFPVRKYAAIFGAVRGVPTDVMRVVLLARTVDRRLSGGDLADADAGRRTERARAVRHAVDAAIDGMDLRLLTAALADGLSQGRGLSTAAVAYARRIVKQDDDSVPAEGEVGEGARRVAEVLRRPEIARLLEDFDARVETSLPPPP